MTGDVAGSSRQRQLRLAYGLLAVILALFSYYVSTLYIKAVPLGEPPDEYAHLTYLKEISQNGRLIPDYSGSVIMNSPRKNYLQHPFLYYTFTGLVGRAMHWDARTNFRNYRRLSSIFVSIGVLLWVLVCRRLDLGLMQTCAVTLAACAIPMFTYLAGSINNDNLAYLGVAIFFYGLSGLLTRSPKTWLVLSLGAIIVFLTKATAGLFITIYVFSVTALLACHHFRHRIKDRYLLHNLVKSGILIACICCAYYIPIIIAYHTPFPHAGETRSIHNPPDHPYNFIQYSEIFVRVMLYSLPRVISHKSFAPIPAGHMASFYLMLGSALASWALLAFRKATPVLYAIHIFIFSLLATLLCHDAYLYHGYLRSGLIAGIQPRYYNYTLPGIFICAFYAIRHSSLRKTAFVIFAVSIPSVMVNSIGRGLSAHSQVEAMKHTVVNMDMNHPIVSNASIAGASKAGSEVALGHIDSVQHDSHTTITITGWTVDQRSHTTPDILLVTYKSKLIGVVSNFSARPDVAKSLDQPMALDSGFEIRIKNIPPSIDVCEIHILSRQRHGSLAKLPMPNCP